VVEDEQAGRLAVGGALAEDEVGHCPELCHRRAAGAADVFSRPSGAGVCAQRTSGEGQ
jgi:hypothetical protein